MPEPVIEVNNDTSYDEAVSTLPKLGGGTILVRYRDEPYVVPRDAPGRWGHRNGDYVLAGEKNSDGTRPHLKGDLGEWNPPTSKPVANLVSFLGSEGTLLVRDLELSDCGTAIQHGAGNKAVPQVVTIEDVHAHHCFQRVVMGSADKWPDWVSRLHIRDSEFSHAYGEHVVYLPNIPLVTVERSKFHSAVEGGHAFKCVALATEIRNCEVSNVALDGTIPPDSHPFNKQAPNPRRGMNPLSLIAGGSVVASGNVFTFMKWAGSGGDCVNRQIRSSQQGSGDPAYYPVGDTPLWDPAFWDQVKAEGLGLDGIMGGNPMLYGGFFSNNLFIALRDPAWSGTALPTGVNDRGTYPTADQTHDPLPAPADWCERSVTALYEGDDLRYANRWGGETAWAFKAESSQLEGTESLNPGERHHLIEGPFPAWFRV